MYNEYQRFSPKSREVPEEVEKAFPGLFNAYKESMFRAAVNAEKRAEHHNGVKVGCAAIVLNKDLDLSSPEMYTGANIKKSPGMLAWPERECAESRVFLNALNVPRPGSVEDPKWKGLDLAEEQGTLKEGGVVVALLAVSEKRNTGEYDRQGHDVLLSCNQCVFNYEGLLKLGIVSRETIVYNARIDEKGKEVKSVQQTIGEVLDKSHEETEKRNQHSISDLLQVRDEQASAFIQKVVPINSEIDRLISAQNARARPVKPNDLKIFNNKLQTSTASLERERVEVRLEEMEPYVHSIINAIASALEEGVSKKLLIEALGLNSDRIATTTDNFSDSELEDIKDQIRVYLNRLG